MTDKILFFFGALGVFNALILSFYFLFVKTTRLLFDYFLGILLLFLLVRVGVSCIYFFGDVPVYIIKLGLAANLILGPTILFLMKVLINPGQKMVNHYLLHVGLLALGLMPTWVLFDFVTWDWRIRFIIHAILTIYLSYSAIIWRKEITSFVTSNSLPSNSKKAVIIYLALVTVCLGFMLALFSTYIMGALTFSIVFYLTIGYFLSSTWKGKKQYRHKKINQQQFTNVHQKLTDLMETENLYRNPDLSLELLADRLSVSRHFLSQMLNDNLKKSFHEYVNEYRIEEACRILAENMPYSMEAIGYEVGFRSRSSFFSAFKKLKGTTPSKYQKVA